MMKIYIYPTFTPSRDKTGNLYLKYFHASFTGNARCHLVNRLWQIGASSIFFNLDADVFIIQWVDLIPFKRLGKIQFWLFLFAIRLLHWLHKEIVWVLHNKQAHKGKSRLVDKGMRDMAKYADCVICHSSDGVSFFDSKYSQCQGKCYYIPHPVYSTETYPSKQLEWDYIIWGGINPRKNVYEFLAFAKSEAFFHDKRILVCGYCPDEEYDRKIQSCTGSHVTYINRFIDDEELKDFISRSKTILFTYNTESLLSSGALIYSLNFCKPIIGPNSGNFADLKCIVSCYNTFKDISLLELTDNSDEIEKYLKVNTWSNFSEKVLQLLKKDNSALKVS